MRLTFRSKLVTIVAVDAVAWLVLMVASSLTERRVDQQLASIQQHYVPRIALQPRLESSFEHVGRSLQDAASAGDTDLLADSQRHLDALLTQIADAGAAAGTVNGVVHDKIYLPGLIKLKGLIDSGFRFKNPNVSESCGCGESIKFAER